ncbi:hypothetical protein [Micromonospora marina]|uniref:hypothetical protein n=1 Tax=Micromonospora marina TaxID=307120 RepID=UPI003D7520D5
MLIPRRGGAPGPALPSAAKGRAAGRKALDAVAVPVAATARAAGDPELGPALRRYLDGEPGPHLAAAGDEDYAVSRAALVPYRSGPLAARAVTDPGEPAVRAWVDAWIRLSVTAESR